MNKVELDGERLTVKDLLRIAEDGWQVDFTDGVRRKIREFREGLDQQLREHPEIKLYGVNTGCGDLKNQTIPLEKLRDYQRRYMRAHNCGTGEPLPINVVRAMMVIRLNSFARGHSAVCVETCQLMIDMLNRQVTPWVLEEGSVGASGDLVPLAMIGAVLLGLHEAQAYHKDNLMSAQEALSAAGLAKIDLDAKEAMALTNGATMITALAAFGVRDATRLLKNASISSALSLEAIRGKRDAFSSEFAESRKHPGHEAVAHSVRGLLEKSGRTSQEARTQPLNHDQGGERVQDRYSFRAVPQVHGAAYDAVQALWKVVDVEINSATDNPLVFKNKKGVYYVQSGANFHGQPLASVIDYLKIALTSLALISDKRSFSMLDKHQNFGLPQDLAVNPTAGDTGLMIAQYAGAARAAECRVLATPASVMSLSTSATQEDFVSMGSIGALHLRKIIHNVELVLAIEVLCALRGLQLTWDPHQPSAKGTASPTSLDSLFRQLGVGTCKVFDYLNSKLSPPTEDRYVRLDMEEVLRDVHSGSLIDIVGDLPKLDVPARAAAEPDTP